MSCPRGTFQFSTPSITSDVLLHIAAFLFGEVCPNSPSNAPPTSGSGPFLRQATPHPHGWGGGQPSQGLGASQQPFSSPEAAPPGVVKKGPDWDQA